MARGAIKRNESRIERNRPMDATEGCGARRAGADIHVAAALPIAAGRNPS